MRIPALTLALLAAGCTGNDPAATATQAPAAQAPTPPAPPTATPPTAAPSTRDPSGMGVPARFQGDYAADTAACRASDDESHLTLGEWRVEFHESSGRIVSVDAGRNELTVTAELTGEGETRQATYHFNLSDDGQRLTDTDNDFARRRC